MHLPLLCDFKTKNCSFRMHSLQHGSVIFITFIKMIHFSLFFCSQARR